MKRHAVRSVGVFAAIAAAAAGCVDSDEGSTESASSALQCSEYEPLASPAAIAKTPRPNKAAELLALEVSGEFVAPDALYERIRDDLEQIVAIDSDLARIRPKTPDDPTGVSLLLDEQAFDAHQRGDYHEWDCLNAAYGGRIVSTGTLIPSVNLDFGGRYFDVDRLMNEYARLSGVVSTSPDAFLGGGSDICLEVGGDTHLYVFVQGWGDCPVGCTGHRFTGYRVTPGEPPTALGSFLSGTPEGGTDPFPDMTPAWYDALTKCRRPR